jgi:hypothetical protein
LYGNEEFYHFLNRGYNIVIPGGGVYPYIHEKLLPKKSNTKEEED